MPAKAYPKRFHVSHLKQAGFERRGLRNYFEYECIGCATVKAGSCFYQPPHIRHREIRHSPDLQMIEFVAPARFKTYAAEKPAARKSPGRRSRG